MKLSIKSGNHKLRNSIDIEDESFDSVTHKSYSCDLSRIFIISRLKSILMTDWGLVTDDFHNSCPDFKVKINSNLFSDTWITLVQFLMITVEAISFAELTPYVINRKSSWDLLLFWHFSTKIMESCFNFIAWLQRSILLFVKLTNLILERLKIQNQYVLQLLKSDFYNSEPYKFSPSNNMRSMISEETHPEDRHPLRFPSLNYF